MDSNDILRRLEAVEKWQADRTAEQITFPLDYRSQETLGKYFMHITNLINYEVVGAAAHTIYSFLGTQDGQNFQLSPQTIFPYSANVSANTLTTTVNFAEDTAVHLNTTAGGTFPAPLAVNTTYYVLNTTGSTFQLALTVGGAAINITSTGTGPQFIEADI
jgi:hypothetical protein